MTNSRISIIVAHSKNMAIGKANSLLWRLPDDLKRFKTLTSGHPVIMGRKTWESLPEKFRPLPGRTNIVVTRDASYRAPGALVASSIEDAISLAGEFEGSEEIFVIGGAEVYKAALPLANRLYVTEVDMEVDGDAFFPHYPEFKETSRENGEHDGLKYSYVILEK